MRILEATVAIMIITSVLIVAYTRQVRRADSADAILVTQRQILMDLTSRSDLRTYVLEMDSNDSIGNLTEYLNSRVILSYGYCLRVCDMDEPGGCGITTDCIARDGGLDDSLVDAIRNRAVYVEETVVSSNHLKYRPKKVKIFMWETRAEDL